MDRLSILGYGSHSWSMTLGIWERVPSRAQLAKRMWNWVPVSWRCSLVRLGGNFADGIQGITRVRGGLRISRLCVADKLAFVLTPAWLYLPMARASGELAEYMERSKERQAGSEYFTPAESARLESSNPREWLKGLQSNTYRWVLKNRDADDDRCNFEYHDRVAFIERRPLQRIELPVAKPGNDLSLSSAWQFEHSDSAQWI